MSCLETPTSECLRRNRAASNWAWIRFTLCSGGRTRIRWPFDQREKDHESKRSSNGGGIGGPGNARVRYWQVDGSGHDGDGHRAGAYCRGVSRPARSGRLCTGADRSHPFSARHRRREAKVTFASQWRRITLTKHLCERRTSDCLQGRNRLPSATLPGGSPERSWRIRVRQ